MQVVEKVHEIDGKSGIRIELTFIKLQC